jgi:hypothetical protein
MIAIESVTATISGRHYVNLPNPGLEVGVLLDASAQHTGRTGREILTIAQRFMGLPRVRVEEMLALVSLTPQEAQRPHRGPSEPRATCSAPRGPCCGPSTATSSPRLCSTRT